MISDDSDLSYPDWANIIDNWVIGTNAERDRGVLKRRLLDGIGYERLAEEFQLSASQIKRILDKRQKQIFKHIC